MNDNKLREALAEVSHEIWAHWMTYLFSKCWYPNLKVYPELDAVLIPNKLHLQWTRQMNTNYADLTEHEKDSDREQADKILAVLKREAKCEQ